MRRKKSTLHTSYFLLHTSSHAQPCHPVPTPGEPDQIDNKRNQHTRRSARNNPEKERAIFLVQGYTPHADHDGFEQPDDNKRRNLVENTRRRNNKTHGMDGPPWQAIPKSRENRKNEAPEAKQHHPLP